MRNSDEWCWKSDLHTPSPGGYVAWFAWADRMAETHVQKRCPGCDLWKIWVPKVALAAPNEPSAALSRDVADEQGWYGVLT